MKRLNLLATCVASAAVMSLLTAHAQNLLINPGFEDGLNSWTRFGNAYAELLYTHSGINGVKLFGNWSGAWNATGLFQNLPANGGDVWSFGGYGLNPATDGLTGGNQNFALLKLIWFDGPNGTGNALQPLPGPGAIFGDNPGIESGLINAATPMDQWLSLFASGQAPAGTQSAQFLVLFLQPNWEGGAVWFDDLSAVLVPEPSAVTLLALGVLGLLARRRE